MSFRYLRWLLLGVALAAGIGAGVALAIRGSGRPPSSTASAAEANPNLDPGTPLSGKAHDFTLTDQFGERVSLHAFRGKVVVVSFNDPKCTTICPLTTTALLRAKQLLGPAAAGVQLLGVAANPIATEVKWVRKYSLVHGMLHSWLFLTGSLPQLKRVWREYGIEAQVVRGLIDHTPATFVVDRRGRLSRLYMTMMAYSGVDQQGQELAQSIAVLLPGRPRLQANASLAPISLIRPSQPVTLPRAGGGTVRLGPGSGPHLVLFFDTWETEVFNLSAQLEALNRYQRTAAAQGLPPLVAVDEATVEPSARALPRFLRSLPRPLAYPVAIDESGRLADGYRVQDSPWLELVSRSGRFLFYRDIGAAGWPSLDSLAGKVRAGLARAR